MKITDFFSSTTNFKENELDPSETTPTPAQKSETVISNPSITTPIKEPEFAGLPLKPPRPTVTYKRKKLPLSPPPSSPHQEETISNSVDPIPNLDLDEANAPILVENLSTNNTKDSSPQNKKQKLNSSRNLQQLTLELGQKSGLRKCRECGMEYSSKDEDYLPHFRYHASIIDGIVYKGYKNEKVVYENASSNAKIILIPNNASPSQLKKLSEILETVQVALGAVPLDIKNKWTFVYVEDKRVAGCVVVETITQAFRLVGNENDEIADNKSFGEKTSANCGISRIWVSPNHRRKGIASLLLDAARANMIFGTVVDKEHVAFSQPTDSGLKLATRYFSKNDFLVYEE